MVKIYKKNCNHSFKKILNTFEKNVKIKSIKKNKSFKILNKKNPLSL